VKFEKPEISMSLDEFKGRVKSGAKLVILDDLVLDVTDYQFNHPGGRFSIEQNIGRDISKFFYGGYSLENKKGNFMKPHTHSNISKYAINSLVVARLG
jgi:cytochrome b involved in lipid metabolism